MTASFFAIHVRKFTNYMQVHCLGVDDDCPHGTAEFFGGLGYKWADNRQTTLSTDNQQL